MSALLSIWMPYSLLTASVDHIDCRQILSFFRKLESGTFPHLRHSSLLCDSLECAMSEYTHDLVSKQTRHHHHTFFFTFCPRELQWSRGRVAHAWLLLTFLQTRYLQQWYEHSICKYTKHVCLRIKRQSMNQSIHVFIYILISGIIVIVIVNNSFT